MPPDEETPKEVLDMLKRIVKREAPSVRENVDKERAAGRTQAEIESEILKPITGADSFDQIERALKDDPSVKKPPTA